MKFTTFCNNNGITYVERGHEHCRPGWIQIDCPFCEKSGHFRMGYNLAHGYVHCWACGSHRLIDTLVQLTGLHWRDVRDAIGLVERDISHEAYKPIRGNLEVPFPVMPLMQPHKQYLRGRGFKPKKLVQLWDLQGIGVHHSHAWRIYIPIVLNGTVVSWSTRAVKGQKQRYLSAAARQEARNHKEILYGEDYCQHSIVVNEGPTDVWAIGPGAAATCGIGYSKAQLARIAEYSIRVIIFENAVDAKDRARKLCKELQAFDGDTFNIQLDAKDPAVADKKEIDEIRRRFMI